MKQEPHIVFVTTSNLATNPRLVKEVELAVSLSYKVSIIDFHFRNWSLSLNNEIMKRLDNHVNVIEVSAERQSFFPWVYSSILQLVCKWLVKTGWQHPFLLSQALQKRTVLLILALKKITRQVDLLVAHNPGSFYPVSQYAYKRNIPFGIDVEDYHPGESNNRTESGWMRKLMQCVIPKANYIPAAAPLIMEEIKKDCNNIIPASAVVLNYFPSSEFTTPSTTIEDKLKLVWFSQYIAAGRGLEALLPVIKEFSTSAELHLYGQLDPDFQQKHLAAISNVIVHDPLPQQELHASLSKYDVGIALEDVNSNYNRDICITNKLLAYHQSGLYILASSTKAQKLFMEEHPKHGKCIQATTESLNSILLELINSKHIIRSESINRFLTARSVSSEKEVGQISKIWTEVLLKRSHVI